MRYCTVRQAKKGKEHEFKFEGARGPYDAWRWETQLAGSGKGWSWIGTGGRSNLEKLRYKSVDGDRETMPNSAVSRREMYFRIDRQLAKNSSLNLTYGHFSNDRGLWYSRLNPTDYNYSKMANHLALTYNYKENSATPGYVSVYHYYNQGDTFRPTGVKNQEDLLSYGRWKTTTNGIDWRDSWLLGKKRNRSLAAGFSWRHTSADSDTNYDVSGDPPGGEANRSFGKNYKKSATNITAFIRGSRQIKKLTLSTTRGITHNSANCITTTSGFREIRIWMRKKAGRAAAASATSSAIKSSRTWVASGPIPKNRFYGTRTGTCGVPITVKASTR